jgi:hypothetical protein
MSIFRSLGYCLVMTSLWACSDSAPSVRGGGGGDDPSSGAAGNGGSEMGGSSTSGSGGSSAASGGSMASGGSGDATRDASPSAESGGASHGPCGAPGIFACDDFEMTAVGAKPDTSKWSIAGNAGKTPVVDDKKKAHSGTHSLNFAMTDTQGVFISPTMGFPPQDNSFYVRAWINLASPMKSNLGHYDFIVGATAPENGTEVRLGASQNFGNQLEMLDLNRLGGNTSEHSQFSNGDYTGGNGTTKPGVTLDADRWYCLEGFWNGKAHEFQLWVDDVEVPGLHVTDWGDKTMSWSPMYNVGKLGAQSFSGNPGQLWYDDVAFGTSRIGCQ